MSNKTFLFYDLETSGLSKPFDQVFQFAAIRTDLDFHPLEHHQYWVTLNPDTIPHPQAMLTHGITLNDLEKKGLSEYDAITKIHQLINTAGTISVGYNSLGFDDEFLRFSFYRNLLPPYTHQYANGCSRMDIYPMLSCYKLFAPECIQWPTDHPGSLKLEHIANANGWMEGAAHDALNDVNATIRLAKAMADSKPEMWQYLCGCFDKNTTQMRLQTLPQASWAGVTYQEAILVQGSLGAAQHYHCPALHLGQHQAYRNQNAWLRLDTEDLSTTTMDTIDSKPWVISAKQGEPPIILPPKSRYQALLSDERRTITDQNKTFLQQNPKLLAAIQKHATHYTYPKVSDIDPNARLYTEGFWSRSDNQLCQAFHRANWEERATMLKRIQHPTIKALTIRLIGRNHADLLDENHHETYQHYLTQCWSQSPMIHDHQQRNKLDPTTAMQALNSHDEGPHKLQSLKAHYEQQTLADNKA